jgi:uroporphyrin-III C-methyltransferase
MPALLTAVDSTNHVHLIIGTNPLASARCSRSIFVGATPKVIAPAVSELHYGLQKRIEAGEVEWIQKPFDIELLTTLGREEVNKVVDAVFVTVGPRERICTVIRDLQ